MKKLYSSVLFLLLITSQLFSQWFPQNSGTTDNFIHIKFVSYSIGWAASEYKIFKTTDGGSTWFLQTDLTSEYIVSFFFLEESTGWYIGYNGGDSRIYKTTDGGVSWQLKYSISYTLLKEIKFVNTNVGWCVGLGSTPPYPFVPVAFVTNDSGNSWESILVSPSYFLDFNSVHFINEFQGWIGGYGVIFKTSDGGENWIELPFIINDTGLLKLQFLDSTIGWTATDYGDLYKTTDGGNSWIQQVPPAANFYFVSDQIGWSVSSNIIYNTTDGGNNWTAQNSNTTNFLWDINFINSYTGWAVGDNGTILNTQNGGTPVELVSFIADVVDNDVLISWTTATEVNNLGFEVLRYSDDNSNDWKKLGSVEGKGTTIEPQFYSFSDDNLTAGKYKYKLKQVDYDGSSEYSNIIEIEIKSPEKIALYQNYPNPFNSTTTIQYSIPERSNIKLSVFDVLGNNVAIILNETKEAGNYSTEFIVKDLPSGTYFYRLETINSTISKKLILLK